MSLSAGSGVVLTNCTASFDDRIFTILAAFTAAAGFVSLLANCFVIFLIILFKKWRFPTQRLILYMAITAALLSLAAVLLRVDYENQTGVAYRNFCIFSGFLSQLTGWMFLNAVICIMTSLLVTAFSNKSLTTRLEITFVFVIFVLPFLFNWIPFIQSAYGKAGPWCWIRSVDEDTCTDFAFGTAMQLALWYVPLYVIMIVLIVLYVIVLVKVHRTKQAWTGKFDPQEKDAQKRMRQEVLQLLAYPLIFFLLNILPFINRIYGVINPDNPEPVLWFLSAATFPLQGGAIAIAFSLDPETRKRLTPANMKAAFSALCREKDVVQEYNITTGSGQFEASYGRDERKDMI